MSKLQMRYRFPLLLAVACVCTSPVTAQMGARRPVSEHPLVKNQAAVQAGERRFQQLCGGCHGTRGEGGQGEGHGPNLVTSWEVRRASDARLKGFIHDGISGTAMPPFRLPDEQIVELAAFVRSLNAPASSVPVPGDTAAGKAIFTGKGGCVSCHMIQGQGGYLGPDLSNVGGTLRLDELRNAVLKRGTIPGAGYRPVMIQIAGQAPLKGVVRHESQWSMQVLDERGNLHLLHGPEMKNAVVMEKSWMPDDYGRRLTAAELNNLIAYLSRQAVGAPGRRDPAAAAEPQ
jgi:cytochrome c oxidase cbb3-type subunit 3